MGASNISFPKSALQTIQHPLQLIGSRKGCPGNCPRRMVTPAMDSSIPGLFAWKEWSAGRSYQAAAFAAPDSLAVDFSFFALHRTFLSEAVRQHFLQTYLGFFTRVLNSSRFFSTSDQEILHQVFPDSFEAIFCKISKFDYRSIKSVYRNHVCISHKVDSETRSTKTEEDALKTLPPLLLVM